MNAYVKPIQGTPELFGDDVKNILKQAFVAPSKEQYEKNLRMLKLRKNIVKK